MQKWEYITVRRVKESHAFRADTWDIETIEPTLNQLGQEGWELVGLTSESGDRGSMVAGYTTEEVWVFKRPLLNTT